MTFPHAPLATVASNILAEFGRSVTIRKPNVTAMDPVAGTVTHGTPTLVVANAYFDQVNQFRFAATIIKANDKVAYVDSEVAVGDEILRDAEVWEVVSVTPYELGAGVVAWEALIRR